MKDSNLLGYAVLRYDIGSYGNTFYPTPFIAR
jgi:hypothetical protein